MNALLRRTGKKSGKIRTENKDGKKSEKINTEKKIEPASAFRRNTLILEPDSKRCFFSFLKFDCPI